MDIKGQIFGVVRDDLIVLNLLQLILKISFIYFMIVSLNLSGNAGISKMIWNYSRKVNTSGWKFKAWYLA